MISEEQRARIRRLCYAEYWKVGTIAADFAARRFGFVDDLNTQLLDALESVPGAGEEEEIPVCFPYAPVWTVRHSAGIQSPGARPPSCHMPRYPERCRRLHRPPPEGA
jgi:hypothetical protein